MLAARRQKFHPKCAHPLFPVILFHGEVYPHDVESQHCLDRNFTPKVLALEERCPDVVRTGVVRWYYEFSVGAGRRSRGSESRRIDRIDVKFCKLSARKKVRAVRFITIMYRRPCMPSARVLTLIAATTHHYHQVYWQRVAAMVLFAFSTRLPVD